MAAKRTLSQRLQYAVPGLAFIAVCLVALELSARFKWVNPAILPPPSDVLQVFAKLIVSGQVLGPLVHTTGLLLAGWAMACIVGIGLGLAMGLNRKVYNLLEVLVELVRPVPKPALIPPLMLLLGLGPRMELAIIFLGSFFPTLIATIQGVRGVDAVRLDVARSFRVGRWRVILKVVLPDSLPMILSGVKVSLSLAIVLAVLAEMVTGSGGMGSMIVELQTAFRARDMYAWVLAVALLGLVLVYVFERLEKRIVFWQQES